jgi:hypothetical protein
MLSKLSARNERVILIFNLFELAPKLLNSFFLKTVYSSKTADIIVIALKNCSRYGRIHKRILKFVTQDLGSSYFFQNHWIFGPKTLRRYWSI